MTKRDVLLVDVGIAVVAAVVVLILTPGLAVAAMVAVVVLIACATSGILEARRRRVAPIARRSRSAATRTRARSRP